MCKLQGHNEQDYYVIHLKLFKKAEEEIKADGRKVEEKRDAERAGRGKGKVEDNLDHWSRQIIPLN